MSLSRSRRPPPELDPIAPASHATQPHRRTLPDSGFRDSRIVFVGKPIAPDDRRALEHVARYLLRAPVSLERMRYDPTEARVSIQPLPGEQGGVVELEALEFIARLILHIPDVRERQVLYYGAYANASKLRRRLATRTEPHTAPGSAPPCPDPADSETPTPFEQRRRVRWAQLIRRVWLEDPAPDLIRAPPPVLEVAEAPS